MAKIYCEDCDGVGIAWRAEYVSGEYQGDESMECPPCGGRGYTEHHMVLTATVEMIVEDAFLCTNNMASMRRRILDELGKLDQAEPEKGEVQDES